MLEDIQVKLIISALNEKFKKQEDEHNIAISQIQSLCKHTTLVSIMAGMMCENCGKLIKGQHTLRKYTLKESE